MFREPPELLFRKDVLFVNNNFEHTLVRSYEFALNIKFCFDFSRQTGGLRQITSYAAVFDTDIHLISFYH